MSIEKKFNIMDIYSSDIPVYSFKGENVTFMTISVPTTSYKNDVLKIWDNYNLYAERIDSAGDLKNVTDTNEGIINALKALGIIFIESSKKIFDSTHKVSILNIDKFKLLGETELLISRGVYFLELKKYNPYIGIFWLEQNGQIQELDWLPTPCRNIAKRVDKRVDDNTKAYSINICHLNDRAWLIVYEHNNDDIKIYQMLEVSNTDLFYNEFEIFSAQKLIECLEILPFGKMQHVVGAWDLFFVNRYKYFIGEHPYIDPLDPEVFDIQDKTRMFLIWLHRLQEFCNKLKEFHENGKTILLTKKHNEMNGEYVSYNITFTPEIRKELVSRKEAFQLYAIASDWFVS